MNQKKPEERRIIMPKYIFYTNCSANVKGIHTEVLRSGYRGDDFAFLSAKTDDEAERIITDHRNALLEQGVRTSRMEYQIVDIPKPLKA
jgi:hypothetical protein